MRNRVVPLSALSVLVVAACATSMTQRATSPGAGAVDPGAGAWRPWVPRPSHASMSRPRHIGAARRLAQEAQQSHAPAECIGAPVGPLLASST